MFPFHPCGFRHTTLPLPSPILSFCPQSSWEPWNSPENQLHNISMQGYFQTGMISSLSWTMVKDSFSFIADKAGSLCVLPLCLAHWDPLLIPWWFCFIHQKTLTLTHLFIYCRQPGWQTKQTAEVKTRRGGNHPIPITTLISRPGTCIYCLASGLTGCHIYTLAI